MPCPNLPYAARCARVFEQYEKKMKTGEKRWQRRPTFGVQKKGIGEDRELGVLLRVFVALALSICPAGETVGEIGDVTGSRACGFAQVATERNDTAVVASGGGVGVAVVDEVLHEAVAGCGALRAVLHHVVDGLVGVVGVEFGTSVRLHETGVGDAAVGGGHLDFGAAVSLGGGC